MIRLLVDGLAAWRLAVLIRQDDIADPARLALEQAAGRIAGGGGERFVRDLLACHWCTTVWSAAVVVTARKVSPRVGGAAVRVLAVSAIAGALGERR